MVNITVFWRIQDTVAVFLQRNVTVPTENESCHSCILLPKAKPAATKAFYIEGKPEYANVYIVPQYSTMFSAQS